MRPQTKTQTGVGSSAPMVLDYIRNPFNVGFGAVLTGTATYTVQHTFDNVMEVGAPAATWFDHPDIAAKTASDDGNYAFPVRAIRITISSGTGAVALTAIQAGHRGA